MAATGAIALSGKPAVVYGEPEPPAIEKFVDEVGVLQAKQAERRLAVLDRRYARESTSVCSGAGITVFHVAGCGFG